MALNGSGQFNLATGNPVVSGTTISSTVHNNTMTEIATALSTAIFKDGQQTITANIPFNSNKITGLGAPSTSGDALVWGETADLGGNKLTSVGTATSDSDAARLDQIPSVVRNGLSGYLYGLGLSNGTDSDHDIDIAVGSASLTDGTDFKLFESSSEITKQIDANWSEGDDAGGFPSGLSLATDTWYRVFLIGKDDGTVDAGFDTDASATNLLSDASSYSWFRRIGWVLTDGTSNILPFNQDGDRFDWNDFSTADFSGAGVSTGSRDSITMSAPPDSFVKALITNVTNSTVVFLVTSLVANDDLTPDINLSTIRNAGSGGATSSQNTAEVLLNSSSQIGLRRNGADTTVDVYALGWIDTRGRLA